LSRTSGRSLNLSGEFDRSSTSLGDIDKPDLLTSHLADVKPRPRPRPRAVSLSISCPRVPISVAGRQQPNISAMITQRRISKPEWPSSNHQTIAFHTASSEEERQASATLLPISDSQSESQLRRAARARTRAHSRTKCTVMLHDASRDGSETEGPRWQSAEPSSSTSPN
jgi:hypothetical protein